MVEYRIFYILLTSYFIYSQTLPEYGPFNLSVADLRLCKGPKRRNCSTYSGTVLNETQFVYDIDVFENMNNIEAKIVATSNKNHKWKLPIKSLCDHTFWRPFFEKFLTFKKCVLQKGQYRMDINVADLAEKYYGGSFIYGKWTIKAMFFNNLCNFSCSITEIVLTPKQK